MIFILKAHAHNPTVVRKCSIALKKFTLDVENIRLAVKNGAHEALASAIRFHRGNAGVVASACATIFAMADNDAGSFVSSEACTDILEAIRLHIGDAAVVENGFGVLHKMTEILIYDFESIIYNAGAYETIMDSVRVHRDDESIIYHCSYLLGFLVDQHHSLVGEMDMVATWDEFAAALKVHHTNASVVEACCSLFRELENEETDETCRVIVSILKEHGKERDISMFCFHRLRHSHGCKIWVCESFLDAFKLHLGEFAAQSGCEAISHIATDNEEIGARFTVLGVCKSLVRVVLINEHKEAVTEACRALAILTTSEQNRARAIDDGVIAAVEFALNRTGAAADVRSCCNEVLRNLY